MQTTAPITGRREIRRESRGGFEFVLWWNPTTDELHLAWRDEDLGTAGEFSVAPGDANEAFAHPFAYMA